MRPSAEIPWRAHPTFLCGPTHEEAREIKPAPRAMGGFSAGLGFEVTLRGGRRGQGARVLAPRPRFPPTRYGGARMRRGTGFVWHEPCTYAHETSPRGHCYSACAGTTQEGRTLQAA